MNVVVLLAVVAIVAMVGWYFLNNGVDTTLVEKKAQFERLKASADLYYNRLGFYTGVCADIGITTEIKCTDSESAFALEAILAPGSFYCLDSSGFLGSTRISKGAGTICRR